MDCDKWETVLVQWVNCLKLTGFVENLDVLRCSDFFPNLLHILDSSYIGTIHDEYLRDVLQLIKRNYPNFTFNDLNLTDSTKDITAVCSLLLHYSCVIERKEELITPLCNNLPPTVQLSVRTFLEKITKDVTSEELKSVINNCIKGDISTNTTLPYHGMQAGDSPLARQSPLQDFLKTPSSRLARMLEKDREIKKLRTVLELERFEKADYQEEIKEQKERIKKLGNQMKQKCNEISKLRSELYALENKTPPHHGKFELRDIERHLRSEIENLEHYISQLRTEQDELQDEKEKVAEKLKKSEDEAKLWQQKAVAAEFNFENLTEKYTQQEHELSNLRLQCNEVSALLDELRSAKETSDSFLVSASDHRQHGALEPTPSCEDLAHAIVEVQLKDMEQENADLQKLLTESVHKGNLLQEQLSVVKSSYDELVKNSKTLQTHNEELMTKISDLNESQASLRDFNEQLNEKVTNLVRLNEEKAEDVIELQKKLETISNSYMQTVSLNEVLKNDLKNTENDCDLAEKKLTLANEQYAKIKTEADALQERYKEAVDNYNESAFDVNSLKVNYETLDKNLDASLEKLKKIVCGHNEHDFDDKCSAFNEILLRLEDKQTQEANEKRELESAFSNSEHQIVSLREEILNLNEQEKISLEDKQMLQKCLKVVEQNAENLQELIAEKSDEIKRLSCTISELTDNINELTLLNGAIIAGKDHEISGMQQEILTKNACIEEKLSNETKLNGVVQSLNEAEVVLKNVVFVKEEKIKLILEKQDTLDEQLRDARKEIFKFQEVEKQLKKDFLEKEKQHLEKTHLLNLEIQEYIEKITKLESDLSVTKQNYDVKVNELMNVKEAKQQVATEYEITKVDLLKKNELVLETMKKLEIEMQVIIKEKESLQENLDDLTSNNKKMLQNKEDMLREIENLKDQVRAQLEEIQTIEEECTQKDTVISENGKELLNTKLEIEAKKQECKNLQKDAEKLIANTNSYVFCIDTLKTQNSDFCAKISELNSEISILSNLKVGLEKKNTELELNTENIINSLSIKNEELNLAIQNLAAHSKKSEADIKNLNILLDEANKNLEDLAKDRTSIIQKYDNDILALTNEIGALRNDIAELHLKEIDCLHDLEATKDELSEVFSKYTESLELLKELKSENESQVNSLTENIHSVVEKYNELDRTHQETLQELQNAAKQLEIIENEKISLEVKIINQKRKYEQELELTNEQFTNDIKNLNLKQSKLESSLEKVNSDLEIQRGIQYRLENDVKKLYGKLGVVEQEKQDLLQKMEVLEQNKLQLESDYKSIKLVHGNYVLESENKLHKMEDDLCKEIQQLTVEREELKQQINVLENAISSLQSENESNLEFHDRSARKNEKFISELQEKIASHESNTAKIVEEQKQLQHQITLEKTNYNALKLKHQETVHSHEERACDYENRFVKLKCAFDILQTGKDKLEQEYRDLNETFNRVVQEQNYNEAQLKEKLKLNTDEIDNLLQEVESKNKFILEKEEVIAQVTTELNKVTLVLETMKAGIQARENDLAKTKEHYTQSLTKIEEENLSKISEMSNSFELLKSIHEDLCNEHNNLRTEYDRLKLESERAKATKSELEKTLSEKDAILNVCNKQSSEQEELVRQQENTIAELNNDLQICLSALEQLKNEKVKLQTDLEKTEAVLDKLRKSREDILESQAKIVKETENNILRAHANAVEVKNDLLKQIQETKTESANAGNAKKEVEELLQKEKEAREFLEIRILTLINEKSKYAQLYSILRKNIDRIDALIRQKPIETCSMLENADEDYLNVISAEIEQRIADIFKKHRELTELITVLESDKAQTKDKLDLLEAERRVLSDEKEKLLKNYKVVSDEREALKQEQLKEKNTFESLQCEFWELKSKYNESAELSKDYENLQMRNCELQQKIVDLKDKNTEACNNYQEFLRELKPCKVLFDKLVKERNALEIIVSDLKQKLTDIQIKFLHVKQEQNKQQFEQKEALEIVSEDVQKQFNRYSKIVYNLQSSSAQISERVMEGVLSEKCVCWKPLLKDLNLEEIAFKFEELRERAVDALEQSKSLEKLTQTLETKPSKILKENVLKLTSSSQNIDAKKQEDEWKKKYSTLKQKLTLTENVKNNYEKKLRQLREENKKLSTARSETENDVQYKSLLHQHIQIKEDHDKVLKENSLKYERLLRDFGDYKRQNDVTKTDEKMQTEKDPNIDQELLTLREAYGKLMGDNSKLELDNVTLRKLLEERNSQLGELALIKETYEKLLEENSKLMTEVDTLKYKRNRDKEEFLRMLKKEREEADGRETKKIQEIRVEYEGKLEKMKEKMIKLYKEEVQKEMEKMSIEKTDNEVLMQSVERYKKELEEARRAFYQLKLTQKQTAEKRTSDFCYSNESLTATASTRSDADSRSVSSARSTNSFDRRGLMKHGNTLKNARDSLVRKNIGEDRRYSTLPRSSGMDVIEEVRICKRTSINSVPSDLGHSIQMEDEGELFNNKYLTDLQEGKCVVGTQELGNSRLSELAWRNSMCPPHLQSSYPAETQFSSPTQFKDDDLKTGNLDFDDSMSSRLLPGDKPRRKDIGTTSYKKPGPPTPSKNGGRLSLQGGEQHLRDSQREHIESKTPKRTTPNRLRALFMGRNSSVRDNSENPPVTPRSKRLSSIFRKPR